METQPCTAAFANAFQKVAPFTVSVLDMKYLLINLQRIHVSAMNYQGLDFSAANYSAERLLADDFPKESGWIQEFLERMAQENATIASLLKRCPNLHHLYMALLGNIFSKHHPAITVLGICNIPQLFNDYVYDEVVEVPHVKVKYVKRFDADNPPDLIISDGRPEARFGDVPFYSVGNLYQPFNRDEINHYMYQLSDFRFE
jgi:hypothetical protein